ncbi:hypothetical protein AVEN_44050-1 [Araneus ventricosus]|uniref:Uncharacterized protein n=1 Tax=Araneus ventricosus TaxID=182803 RepID=A0A4Y2H9B2_ARAVE|nr:hypothetical protein AVEN_44050-1 [Araneus ventricosus]
MTWRAAVGVVLYAPVILSRNFLWEAGEDVPVVTMVFRRDRHSDERRYNAATANDIAMVFVNSDGEPPFEREIRVYPLNPKNPQQPFININILSPNLDPMTYSILFPKAALEM